MKYRKQTIMKKIVSEATIKVKEAFQKAKFSDVQNSSTV